MNYTEQFRHHQRLQALVLAPSRVVEYFPIQVFESKQLLHDRLLHAGNNGAHVHDCFQRTVASIIHTLLYGFRILENDDPVLDAVIQSNAEFFGFVQVGAHIVDTFPILNNLPGLLAPLKKRADIHFAKKQAARKANFQHALNKKEWNISKHLNNAIDKEKEDRDMPLDESAFEIGTIIDAALDGTTDSLIWFVVACVTQDNDFVAKARLELDAVVGRHRLPVPEDRDNLPYITAITEEIFCWRPVGPEGAPHFNKEETNYRGCRIPARSVVVANLLAIAREEAVFGQDVELFKPERWLEDVDTTGTRKLKALPLAAFGYGRRICPGRHFGRNAVWIVVAQLLWSFDIAAGRSDATGRTEQVDPLACTYGLVMRVLPFKATFKPRGQWVMDVINDRCDTRSQAPDAMLSHIGAAFARA